MEIMLSMVKPSYVYSILEPNFSVSLPAKWVLPTLEFLINVQHVYFILSDFSLLHALIRNCTFIDFQDCEKRL